MSQNFCFAGSGPGFLVQPLGISVSLLGVATFTTLALGNGSTVTYQWYQNGVAVPNATGINYTISNVQLSSQGAYYVVASDSGGSTTSSTVPLSIPNVAPSVSSQPQSETVANGATNAGFSVTASGTYPITYQWTFNSANISGATSSVLTFPSAGTNNAGSYAVVMHNSVGTLTSSVATLTVMLPPSISAQPSSQLLQPGQNTSFGVVANNAAGYQWNFNGNPLSGATNSTLALSSVQTGNAGNYSVVVSNVAGAITSAVANLAVIPNFALAANPTSSGALTSTGFVMQFSVPASCTYVVSATSDFANWTPLSTNVASVSGNVTFTDSTAANHRSRFYRVAMW